MLYKKFVELGRVIQITKGRDTSKLGVVVNIIDCNRLLVDGPGLHRQEVKLRDARLLKYKLGHINPSTSVDKLKKKWESKHFELRFQQTPTYQRQQKLQRRSEITDFDFFNMRHAMRKRSNIIHNAMNNVLHKEPRAVRRIKREFKKELRTKLGYNKGLKRTPEQKKSRDEKQLARFKSNVTKRKTVLKERKEKRAARLEERKKKPKTAGTKTKKEGKKPIKKTKKTKAPAAKSS